jgi:type VI secretion system protein VasD
MRTLRTLPIALFFLVSVACLVACKSAPPKPPIVKLSITAAADVNPDAQNRASPVVVRVYQLKDDAAFKDADFFALYDKEQATLAAALGSRQEFELAPGEHRLIDFEVALDTRFIGVAAAYRDLRNAEWRAQTGSTDKPLAGVMKKHQINIAVGRARVSVAAE